MYCINVDSPTSLCMIHHYPDGCGDVDRHGKGTQYKGAWDISTGQVLNTHSLKHGKDGEWIHGFFTYADAENYCNEHHGNMSCEYCRNCKTIEAAHKLSSEAPNLTDKEKKELEQDIADVALNTPRSSVAMSRLRRLADRAGEPTKNAIKELLSSIASDILVKLMRGW